MDILSKLIIFLFILAIFGALGLAMFRMISKPKDPKTMARALSWRIGLSITLFVILMVLVATGVLKPRPAPTDSGIGSSSP